PTFLDLLSFPTRRSSDLLTIGFVSRDKFDYAFIIGFQPLNAVDNFKAKPATILGPKPDIVFTAIASRVFLPSVPKIIDIDHHMRDRKSTRLNSSHVKISY